MSGVCSVSECLSTWSPALVKILGYFYGVVIAGFLIAAIMDEAWRRMHLESKLSVPHLVLKDPWGVEAWKWQTSSLGAIERVLYMASIHLGKPEFIGVWLTIKTVAVARRWTESSLSPARAVYNTFLIGNGLSILYSIVGALFISWALGITDGVAKDLCLAFWVPIISIVFGLSIYFFYRFARLWRNDKTKPGA